MCCHCTNLHDKSEADISVFPIYFNFLHCLLFFVKKNCCRSVALKELNDAFAVESTEYAALKEHFDRIDLDIGRRDQEELILEALQRREDFGMYVLFRAAANIQKIHRGRMAREAVNKIKVPF